MMISELEEFFDGNSTSLEIMELYEDYSEDKSKKTALNAVRKELMKTYGNESELIIVLNMTLNWCALKSGFSDEKSREYLERLNKETIQAVFEKNDAILIEKVIKSLLEMKPIKPKKEKPDYSNPGSKNWKKGDIFAYKLIGPIYLFLLVLLANYKIGFLALVIHIVLILAYIIYVLFSKRKLQINYYKIIMYVLFIIIANLIAYLV